MSPSDGLDRETEPVYEFQVTAMRGALRESVMYHVTVLDENDNAPTFHGGTHHSIMLNENETVSGGCVQWVWSGAGCC